MTLRDCLRVLRERWRIITGAVIVAVVAAGATWWLRPAEYTATVRMYVSAQSTDTAQAAFQGAQLSQQRVTSYVELVTSERVTAEVVRQLNLSSTAEEVGEHITATSKLDSVIIDVDVTGRSPQNVADVANAVGLIFPRLIDELERPSSPTGTPPIVVRVVQQATVPEQPSSTGLPVALAFGLLMGLIIGIGGALLRAAVDTAIKSPEQLRAVAEAPSLGVIAFDSKVPKQPLTVHEDPQSPRAEAFRQLRTNLQFLDVDRPHKVLVVTSSMPSEGKTTTLANVAVALASAGHRVLVVDADLRRPKLADLLGLERSVGLTSVLAGRVRSDHAIQHWSGGLFDVLASGPLPPNPSELLSSQQMTLLLGELRHQYDTILIDTPPLLPVTDAAALASATDGAVVVCRFKATHVAQVKAAVDSLDAVSVPVLGTVLTMVPNSGSRAYAQYNSYYRSQQVPRPVSPTTGTPTVSGASNGTVQPQPPRPSPWRNEHGRTTPKQPASPRQAGHRATKEI